MPVSNEPLYDLQSNGPEIVKGDSNLSIESAWD